jgi:hypothetical protein
MAVPLRQNGAAAAPIPPLSILKIAVCAVIQLGKAVGMTTEVRQLIS